MKSFDYKLSSFKEKKIRDKYLLVSFTGKWVSLSLNEYKLFKMGDIDDELFLKLEKNHIIYTKKSNKDMIDFYKNKKQQLFQGTSLHIIIVSLRCNEDCIYCHAASTNVKTKGVDMSRETARKVVDFIFQSPSNAITIEFQGGEPLLNMDAVKEVIEYAKKKNKIAKKSLRFSLVTNLSLMTDEIFNYLLKEEIYGICTSLDGPKELHDKNRPMLGKSSYDLAVKWINKISENKKMKINALMSTTKHSLLYAKEIIDEYRKLGIKTIWFRMLNDLGTAKGNWKNISYSAEEYFEFWKKGINYSLKKDDIVERSSEIFFMKFLNEKDPMYLDLMSPCGAAIGQMAYNHNGEIFSCDEARMLNDDLFKIGNVYEDTYNKVMSSSKVCNLISSSVNDSYQCNSCTFQPFCGLCPVCTFGSTKSLVPNLTLDFRCKVLKKQFEFLFEKILFDYSIDSFDSVTEEKKKSLNLNKRKLEK